MEGKAKFANHIILVMLKITISLIWKILNNETATEPFISQSKTTKLGIIEAKRYIVKIIGIALK